jgi:hypothetical protein
MYTKNNRRYLQGVPTAQTTTDAQDMEEEVHSIVHDIGDGTGPLEFSSNTLAVNFLMVIIAFKLFAGNSSEVFNLCQPSLMLQNNVHSRVAYVVGRTGVLQF